MVRGVRTNKSSIVGPEDAGKTRYRRRLGGLRGLAPQAPPNVIRRAPIRGMFPVNEVIECAAGNLVPLRVNRSRHLLQKR
jgi:hypothetical protein